MVQRQQLSRDTVIRGETISTKLQVGTPHAAFDPQEFASIGRKHIYPSHKGQTKPSIKNVEGNERADSAAKDAAKNEERKKYGWSSFTY